MNATWKSSPPDSLPLDAPSFLAPPALNEDSLRWPWINCLLFVHLDLENLNLYSNAIACAVCTHWRPLANGHSHHPPALSNYKLRFNCTYIAIDSMSAPNGHARQRNRTPHEAQKIEWRKFRERVFACVVRSRAPNTELRNGEEDRQMQKRKQKIIRNMAARSCDYAPTWLRATEVRSVFRLLQMVKRDFCFSFYFVSGFAQRSDIASGNGKNTKNCETCYTMRQHR